MIIKNKKAEVFKTTKFTLRYENSVSISQETGVARDNNTDRLIT